MGRFNEFDFGEEVFGNGGVVAPDITTGRVAWNFYDHTDSYDFYVNPLEASMPTLNKKVTYQATAAGKQVSYEGRPQVGSLSFSGVILEEAQYLIFREWWLKRKQVRITDDLGQKYWVYLKSFNPTRRKNNTYDWLMDYTAEGIVLDRGSY